MKDNIRIRRVDVEVKGSIISYDEYYMLDENGEEIFNRELEIENDKRLYDIYKRMNNLLTTEEIKNIRNKYSLTQKDYAAVIGVGEVTVHRFEKGSIQTESVDSIMRLSSNPDNMYLLLLQNKDKVSKEIYNSLLQRIKELRILKEHKLVDISDIDKNILDFEEESAIDIAKEIINIYNLKVDELAKEYGFIPEYITNLKLQKLLYYVQAICLLVFDNKAFSEKIYAWSYGPVVKEVYDEYKINHKEVLNSDKKGKDISSGIKEVINKVVDSYGNIETTKLIDFTHEEDPWKNTKLNEEIEVSSISDYFNKVYN